MPRLPDMSRLPIRDKLWLPDALRCGGVGNCQSAPDGHNALLRDMDRLSSRCYRSTRKRSGFKRRRDVDENTTDPGGECIDLSQLAWSGSQMSATANAPGVVCSSSDGIKWNRVSLGFSGLISRLIWTGESGFDREPYANVRISSE